MIDCLDMAVTDQGHHILVLHYIPVTSIAELTGTCEAQVDASNSTSVLCMSGLSTSVPPQIVTVQLPPLSKSSCW